MDEVKGLPMIGSNNLQLLRHLQAGSLDPADTAMLEHSPASQVIDEFRSVYGLTFQERRLGRKWEVALARSLRVELAVRPIPDAIFASRLWTPAYLNCLMVNVEDDAVTGISRLTRLTVREVDKPDRGLALRTGHGFKLDKTPDGWAIKPLRRRTVRLSEAFLKDRGWRFDHLKQLVPSP